MFPQALYEREEEEMNDGNKTLNIKQETQNKLISRYGKYSMKVWLISQALYERDWEENKYNFEQKTKESKKDSLFPQNLLTVR